MHEVVLAWTAADRGAVYQGQCSSHVLQRNKTYHLDRALAVPAVRKYACCFHRWHVRLSGTYRFRRPTKHIRFLDPAVVGTNGLLGQQDGRALFEHISGDKTPQLLELMLRGAGYPASISTDRVCAFADALPKEFTEESRVGQKRNLFDEMLIHNGFAHNGSATDGCRIIHHCDARGIWHEAKLAPEEQVWSTWDWRVSLLGRLQQFRAQPGWPGSDMGTPDFLGAEKPPQSQLVEGGTRQPARQYRRRWTRRGSVQAVLQAMVAERQGRWAGERTNFDRASWSSTLWNLRALDQGSMDMLEAITGEDMIRLPVERAPPECMRRCGGLQRPVVRLENRDNGSRVLSEPACHTSDLLVCEIPSHEPDAGNETLGRQKMSGIDLATRCVNRTNELMMQSEVIRVWWHKNRSAHTSNQHSITSPDHAAAFEWATLMGCIKRPELERLKGLIRENERCQVPAASVQVIVMDSTSRVSFLVSAIKSRRWLEDLGANPTSHKHLVLHYPFMNIIGWGTPQNLNALFAACPPIYACPPDFESRNCATAEAHAFPPLRDGCDKTLAELYSARGYVTVLKSMSWPLSRAVEGFDHRIDLHVDWLSHVHTCRASGECGAQGSEGDYAPYWPSSEVPHQHCLGDFPIHQMMLEYVQQCHSHYSIPTFSVLHTFVNHEMTQSGMARLDPYLYTHLKQTLRKPTFVLLIGDHGLNYGEYATTIFGQHEHRTPINILIAPKSHLPYEPLQALYENQKHPLTVLDLYETLKEIPSLHCWEIPPPHHKRKSPARSLLHV